MHFNTLTLTLETGIGDLQIYPEFRFVCFFLTFVEKKNTWALQVDFLSVKKLA